MVTSITREMKPCIVGTTGKCVSNYAWCQYNCGRCTRHCPKNKCPNKQKHALQDVTNKTSRRELRDCSLCKRKFCGCGSGLCCFHCLCQKSKQPTLPKVPSEKRSNHLAANDAITKCVKADLVPVTPAKTCFQVLDESDVEWLDNDVELDNNTELNTRVSESQPSEHLVVETFSHLLQSFGIDSKSRTKNFPSEKMRSDPHAASLIKASKNSRNSIPAMVNLLLQVVEVAASLIIPGDPAFLLEHLGKKLLQRHGSSSGDDRSEGMEKAMRNTFLLCHKMPKHTMGYRVLRAVLVESFSEKKLGDFIESMDPPKVGRNARSRGLNDFNHMFFEQNDPIKKKRTLLLTSNETVERAVEDILSPANVGVLAWGTTILEIPGTKKRIIFPRLTRKRAMEEMWTKFQSNEKGRAIVENQASTRNQAAKLETLHRSKYLEIASTLTADRLKVVKSVDYVTDQLINERVSTLQRIIMDLVAPAEKKNNTHHLSLVQNFLKYQYDLHARKNDGVSCHVCLSISHFFGFD
jgi:hypothetical protein